MDSLIWKIFTFQFVNSYTSLYYIAFFKNGVNIWGSNEVHDECKMGMITTFYKLHTKLLVLGEVHPDIISSGCMIEVTMQLVIILGTNIVVGQSREFLIP
jgi:hypothetical protein